MLAHGAVEGFFPGMAKGRMTDVVHQSERLDQVYIQVKCSCDGTRDLSNLDGMRKTISKVIRVAAGEDLGLGFEASKGARMNDAIPITLKIVAIGMGRLGAAAPAGILHAHRVISEHIKSLERKGQGFKFPSFKFQVSSCKFFGF